MMKELGNGSIDVEEALNWTLNNEALRSALIDNVRHNIDIPDERLDTWHGEVELVNKCGVYEFVVTLYA